MCMSTGDAQEMHRAAGRRTGTHIGSGSWAQWAACGLRFGQAIPRAQAQLGLSGALQISKVGGSNLFHKILQNKIVNMNVAIKYIGELEFFKRFRNSGLYNWCNIRQWIPAGLDILIEIKCKDSSLMEKSIIFMWSFEWISY